MQRLKLIALSACLSVLSGCASAPPRTAQQDPDRAPRIVRTNNPGTPLSLGRVSPPAVLNGAPVSWESMHTALVEAAGGVVLEELVLDRLLEAEADRLGIATDSLDTARELAILQRTLAGIDPGSGPRLLEELRRSRGLGPERFEALLHRTALMRALVAPRVVLTPESLSLAAEIRYGEKRRVRVITVPSLIDAQTVLRQLERGEAFAEIAAKVSTDASAARGGLIEPMSPADPSYPAAFRQAVAALTPGQWSEPVALTGSYAIVTVDEIIPAQNTPDALNSPTIEADARAEQERILMTALARRLLDNASLNILDPSLQDAWRRRGNQ